MVCTLQCAGHNTLVAGDIAETYVDSEHHPCLAVETAVVSLAVAEELGSRHPFVCFE